MIEKFKALHAEEEDYDWAIQIETRIRDFFQLHELSNQVQVVDVTCKTNTCEVYGYQNDDGAFSTIMLNLRDQTWFTSLTSNSMTGDSLPEGEDRNMSGYFYVMFSMYREQR